MSLQLNIYTLILLLGCAQGSIYAILLLIRSQRQQRLSDALLAGLLGLTVLLILPYLLAFMDIHLMWRELLFFPLDPTLLLGPAWYFYLVSQTNEDFRLGKKQLLHFLPIGIYALYHLSIFVQGPEAVQSWMAEVDLPYVSPVYTGLCLISNFLYLFWTFQHYRRYQNWVETEYSNPEEIEFSWYRNYLLILAVGISLSWLFQGLNEWGITLSYTQNWWEYFFFAMLLYFLSIPGYHQTQVVRLHFAPEADENESAEESPGLPNEALQEAVAKLAEAMRKGEYFLNPKLSLAELSRALRVPSSELSQVINAGFGKNFNQFVNAYRVAAFQEMVMNPASAHLSFLAIALDCGFNSKATFNRVFKQMTELSPKEYVSQQKKRTLLEQNPGAAHDPTLAVIG
jgi:AraC-like DNA-binding protein